MPSTVRILPSGHEFVVEANESLLHAALRHGLALEFGCTNGSCGECKGWLKDGALRKILHHDYAISDTERREGLVLLCCCTADGEVTIEAREASRPEDIPLQRVRARLYKQEGAGGAVQVVHLRVMRGKMLRFLAGQHVLVKSTGAQAMELPIASCPCDGHHLEFHFDPLDGDELSTRAAAGFGRSDRFEVEGPRGGFVLDEASDRPLIFLALDTAIAPIKSILEHAINLELPQPIRLHWHTTKEGGHYLHNYFRSLADALDTFCYVPLDGADCTDSLTRLPDLEMADVYLAGSDGFVATARDRLLARGLPEERLFIDALGI